MSMGSLIPFWIQQSQSTDTIEAPPAAPSVTIDTVDEPTEPDKDVSETNAGVADEKRRVLSALPKATKTKLDQTGDQGTVQKKNLLGSGATGNTNLG